MIDEETRRKLRELKLSETIEALEMQDTDSSYMTFNFDDRIKMIVDFTYEQKCASTIERLRKRARLRYPEADMTQIIYEGRGLDRVLIQEVSTCQFANLGKNIVIEGYCGTGKTYLACAIGRQACKMRLRVSYIRVPDLLMERDELAATQRSDQKILRKYSSPDVLILDEWLGSEITKLERHFIFELIERRYSNKSTLFCSQYACVDWHVRLGGEVQADAIMDRILHDAIRLNLGEKNMRGTAM